MVSDDEAAVREVHSRYFEALGAGDMQRVAEQFAYPAVFKGFLEDVVLAQNAQALIATYRDLIAAAPKAARSELHSTDVVKLRPGVFTLTMHYTQFSANDEVVHEGRAVYLIKGGADGFKICGVF